MKSIKRYGNRRLYDFDQNKYINYRDLRAHVRSGGTFVVRQHPTKKDVTPDVIGKMIASHPAVRSRNPAAHQKLWNTLRAL